MSDLEDKASAFASRAIDLLFVVNPKGTSLGVALGVVLNGVIALFNPILSQIKSISIGAINIWHEVFFGVFIFNIRPYIRRNKVDDKLHEALEYVRKLEKENKITKVRASHMYNEILKELIRQVTLDGTHEKQKKDIQEILARGED
jgi:hypothetical protein